MNGLIVALSAGLFMVSVSIAYVGYGFYDVSALKAENARLIAENERVTDEMQRYRYGWANAVGTSSCSGSLYVNGDAYYAKYQMCAQELNACESDLQNQSKRRMIEQMEIDDIRQGVEMLRMEQMFRK